MKRPITGLQKTRGFTIMELLIATVVFSVVLLVVTGGILQVARVYYKGVTESTTQNTARGVIDIISQSIQFSGGSVDPTPASPTPGTNYAFCVGDQQFNYRPGWQVENNPNAVKNQTWHGLVQTGVGQCSSGTPVQPLQNQAVTGRDLVGSHMRVAKLTVESAGGNAWRVTVRIIYGDNDLLNNPTASNASCKGVRAGTQFCAVAELSTVVVKRVE
jgi:prepilin-type N-terminal cleavage/methylation domain-containing protein